jgi:PEP-CTERM motif
LNINNEESLTMRIKKPFLQLIATAVIGLNAVAASATSISGDWVGNWSGSGVTATFNMTVGAEDSFGHYNGFFDWTCTSGITCSGVENFTGATYGVDSFTFWTTTFVNPVNLGPSVYWGNITNGGLQLVGFDKGPTDTWTATRVNSVPEPGALTLMSLGLLGMGLSMRKKLPAATKL